jgi:hypothetical protein
MDGNRRGSKAMKKGAVGVITSEDQTLMEIDFVTCGMIFCHALHNPKMQKCCYIEEFWLLVDSI